MGHGSASNAKLLGNVLQRLWNKWDIRGSLFASFVAQAYLTLVGTWRRGALYILFDIAIWVCYTVGWWVTNFALDMIYSNVGVGDSFDDSFQSSNYNSDYTSDYSFENNSQRLMALWATFMLVHLGGPDSITAYAIEDNALWFRDLVFLLVQSARVVYVVYSAWKYDWLSYISISMLVVGIIKCGERTWALYYASIDTHRDMLLYSSSVEETENSHVIHTAADGDTNEQRSATTSSREQMRLFVSLFEDLVFSDEELRTDQAGFRRLDVGDAFKRVEAKLSYAFDIFYTKASVRNSYWGQASQFITLFITIFVLVCFKVIPSCTSGLSKKDNQITIILIAGSVILEMYAIGKLYAFCSRWTKRFEANKFLCTDLLRLCITWNYYAPPNIPLFRTVRKRIDRRIWNVHKNLKSHIFNHMKGLRSARYDYKEEIQLESIEWTKELDFHRSILTWHIATDICYHCDYVENDDKKICKELSDYMLYLLVYRRSMLPIGTGLGGFRDTFDEIKTFLRRDDKWKAPNLTTMLQIILMEPIIATFQRKQMRLPSERHFREMLHGICKKLLEEEEDDVVEKRRNRSALAEGRRLARSLRQMENQNQMWDMIANVWTGILGHAAANYSAYDHAKQLSRGGEFLTHVWLLMAHLGLLEQFQIATPQRTHETSTSNISSNA